MDAIQPETDNNYIAWFKLEGKRYKLFKRERSKDAPWYVHFQHKTKRFKRSLDTNHARKAEHLARAIISAVKSGAWVALTETKQHQDSQERYATIGDVLDHYKRNPGEVKDRTARGNVGALVKILTTVFEKENEEEIRKLSIESLDRSVVRKYKETIVGADDEGDDDDDEEGVQRAKRTANSYLRQGRSVFSQAMLETYQDAGLKLPMDQLREFVKATGFKGAGKTEYHVPDDGLIRKTFAALEKLRTSDVEVFKAICCACGAGLRKSEIGKVRWNWFKESRGGVVLDSNVIGKDNLVIKNVPVMMEWWKRLQKVRPADAKADDYILTGSKTTRTEDIFRRVGAWMRSLGWQTQKTIHEFRAYVGSKVAEAHGIEAAAMFLRHKEPKVTRDFYLRYVEARKIQIANFGARAVGN